MEMDRVELNGDRVRIYLDMDGVLADFDRGVNEMCQMKAASQNRDRNPQHDDLMWEKIRETDHFYDRLELMPGAKAMFDRIYEKYGERCEILTGIPKPERGIVTAGPDKITWMKRCLSDRIRVNIVLRKQKLEKCEGPESVLIDDREDTIRDWRNAGGTGILHTSAENTLQEMETLGLL